MPLIRTGLGETPTLPCRDVVLLSRDAPPSHALPCHLPCSLQCFDRACRCPPYSALQRRCGFTAGDGGSDLGNGRPGKSVAVSTNGTEAAGTADGSGRWSIKFPAQDAGGPFDLTVQGKNEIVLHDIVVGEVWVASGQSNMQFPLMTLDPAHPVYGPQAREVIAASNDPLLRMFTVGRHVLPDKPVSSSGVMRRLMGKPAGDSRGHSRGYGDGLFLLCPAVLYYPHGDTAGARFAVENDRCVRCDFTFHNSSNQEREYFYGGESRWRMPPKRFV